MLCDFIIYSSTKHASDLSTNVSHNDQLNFNIYIFLRQVILHRIRQLVILQLYEENIGIEGISTQYLICYNLLCCHIEGKYLNARKNQIYVIVTLSSPGVLEYNVIFLSRFLQKSNSIIISCSHRNRRCIDYILNIRLLIIIDVVNKIGSL